MSNGTVKRKFFLSTGFIALGLVGIYAYADESRMYGPYVCTACTVSTPVADSNTQDYIKNKVSEMENKFFPSHVNVGDKIVVCNANACVTYMNTNNNDWLGNKAVPRTTSSNGGGGGGEGGGGGGGGGGSSGGVNLPGGCIGHCNGSVTVGGR
ncbi:hypothetical protein K8O61_07005 [Xanthomonas cerealis pv. cerealis]|uniref:hypothetical protein n=1 Tax=Xanthomonas cerealis TaxID=3390025 RepID=UPI001F3B1CBA|nr:hypothetical protein [Xanthomonas translucens]UKE70762.1 hypothetical protein K8O61_07005 [Xanthomonas translucens pv. pistacia]